jgi:hypothetical protein
MRWLLWAALALLVGCGDEATPLQDGCDGDGCVEDIGDGDVLDAADPDVADDELSQSDAAEDTEAPDADALGGADADAADADLVDPDGDADTEDAVDAEISPDAAGCAVDPSGIDTCIGLSGCLEACVLECPGDIECPNACTAGAPNDVIVSLAALQTCQAEKCPGLTGQAKNDCAAQLCTAELYACIGVGTVECVPTVACALSCPAGSGAAACEQACTDAASPGALANALTYLSCLDATCPPGAGPICRAAAVVTCRAPGVACGVFQGAQGCQQAVACVLQCATLADAQVCALDCAASLGFDTSEEAAVLLACGVETCGTATDFPCMGEAFDGACAAQAEACYAPAP